MGLTKLPHFNERLLWQCSLSWVSNTHQSNFKVFFDIYCKIHFFLLHQTADINVLQPHSKLLFHFPELPLAFTHRPGCMLLTDTPSTKPNPNPAPEDLPRVVWLSDTPPLASVLSQATMDKIKKLETAAIEDIGKVTSLGGPLLFKRMYMDYLLQRRIVVGHVVLRQSKILQNAHNNEYLTFMVNNVNWY